MRKTVMIMLGMIVMMTGEVNAAAPTTEANKFRLKSSDGTVEVIFDKKYGGAITGVYDYNNGGINLVDDSQAGAMFQTAFWIIPYHQWLDASKPLPPGCGNTDDMKLDNPTQAGFMADGHAGNPIGVRGTSTTVDPEEFIRWENNNKTLHFKNRFIRYDYCFMGQALLSEAKCDAAAKTSYLNDPNATCKDLWDTDFYLEQWATFRSDLKYVMELKSKITYVGTGERGMTSRQLPVIFTANTDRHFYRMNGVGVSATGTVQVNTDKPWMAQINLSRDAGLGMVMSRNTKILMGRKMWDGQIGVVSGGVGVFAAGQGTIDLPTIGSISSGVKIEPSGVNTYFFSSGGSVEWTTYYPIGKSDYIRKAAEAVLMYPSGKTMDENVDGWADVISCNNSLGWARDMKVAKSSVAKVRAEIYPVGEYDKKVIRETSTFSSRSDLKAAGICDACVYGLNFGNLPASFKDKKLIVDVWGVTGTGEWLLSDKNNMVGPCSNLGEVATNTPTISPGDWTGDGKVGLEDFGGWKTAYLEGRATLVDFGIWKEAYLTR